MSDVVALTERLVPEAPLRAWIGQRLPGSGPFTVRRITVWKTVSPQASTRRSMTSRPCRVRPSNMVPRTPSISRRGFSRSRTLSMVVLSRATPRRAKYSHSSGTITLCEAVRAFTVSRPSDGWQSMSTMS